MSLATKKITDFVNLNYKGNEAQFFRDAVDFFNSRNEYENQDRNYESLLLDFIDSWEGE